MHFFHTKMTISKWIDISKMFQIKLLKIINFIELVLWISLYCTFLRVLRLNIISFQMNKSLFSLLYVHLLNVQLCGIALTPFPSRIERDSNHRLGVTRQKVSKKRFWHQTVNIKLFYFIFFNNFYRSKKVCYYSNYK